MRAPKEGTIWFYAVSTANGGQGGSRRVRVVRVGRGDDGLAYVDLRGMTSDGVDRVSLFDFTQRATPMEEKHALRPLASSTPAPVKKPPHPLVAEIAKRRERIAELQREVADLEAGLAVMVQSEWR